MEVLVNNYIRGIDLIKSNKNNYYVYNGHGDVTQITNSAGSVMNNYDYARDIITINQRNPVKHGLSTVYGYFFIN